MKLGVTVIFGFMLSFGPFIVHGQLFTVMKRLFPIKRGLIHAYWAPNFWALYCFFDRLAAFAAKKFDPTFVAPEGSTSGLVQQTEFAFLPNVPPYATIVLTVVAWVPLLIKLWKHPKG